MQRTNIYLDDRQLRALDRLAQARGVSRAEVVRTLIDRGLSGGEHDPASDLAAIEASFGVLGHEQPGATFQRGDDARANHLRQAWARRC